MDPANTGKRTQESDVSTVELFSEQDDPIYHGTFSDSFIRVFRQEPSSRNADDIASLASGGNTTYEAGPNLLCPWLYIQAVKQYEERTSATRSSFGLHSDNNPYVNATNVPGKVVSTNATVKVLLEINKDDNDDESSACPDSM